MKNYIHTKGGKIYYSDAGTGKPVILLHGHLESSESWDGFAEKLSERYRVISVDLPGHGSSSIFGETHTMEFMAGLVRELLDILDIRRVFITGHSLGGYVTLAFAELYPESLSGYCLFHSHPFADTPETIHKREREIEVVRSGKKYLMYPENVSRMFAPDNIGKFSEPLQRAKDIAARLSDEGIIAVLRGMVERPSRLEVLEAGKVPCLWILGRSDTYIQAESTIEKVSLPANARVRILENSGHLGFIEEEEISLGILSEFIEATGA